MSLSKKEVRKIVGFTFSEVGSDPKNWLKVCQGIQRCRGTNGQQRNASNRLPIPYYFNAALSLELILKAIAIIVQGKAFENSHRLNELCNLRV